MHSIDPGYSVEKRRDNWTLISKYLKEIGEINLKIENIDLFLKNENNEILTFIIQLYQELTKKKVSVLEGRRIKTDIDNINKSYLLKETGEVELIKKDNEVFDKKAEELQKSIKTNTTVLTQKKNTSMI
jgi:hypothetical protein